MKKGFIPLAKNKKEGSKATSSEPTSYSLFQQASIPGAKPSSQAKWKQLTSPISGTNKWNMLHQLLTLGSMDESS